MNTTTEHAFESQVEEILLRQGGWRRVANAEWDVERALFPARVCAFLEATQPKLWAQMRALHAAGLEPLLVDALARELDLKGTLHVLRHGFKFYGKDLPDGLVQARPCAERRSVGALRKERADDHAAGALPSEETRHGGPAVRAERTAGGDLRAQEPRHRPELASRGAAVPERPRPERATVPFQGPGAGALRRGPGRGAHEHPHRRGGDALPALQPRQPSGRGALRRRQSAAPLRIPHGLFLGRGAGTRELPGRPRPLHVRRDEGREGGRRQGGSAAGHEGDPDLPPLPPARRGAEAHRRGARRGLRPELPDPALRGERQDQQHLLAVPPAREPPRPRGPQGLRLRRGHHRSPRAGPPASGRHLPDRARPGRGQGHRPGQQAARRRADRRHPDRRHHVAEVPVRAARAVARRGGGVAGGGDGR